MSHPRWPARRRYSSRTGFGTVRDLGIRASVSRIRAPIAGKADAALGTRSPGDPRRAERVGKQDRQVEALAVSAGGSIVRPALRGRDPAGRARSSGRRDRDRQALRRRTGGGGRPFRLERTSFAALARRASPSPRRRSSSEERGRFSSHLPIRLPSILEGVPRRASSRRRGLCPGLSLVRRKTRPARARRFRASHTCRLSPTGRASTAREPRAASPRRKW